jgi:hypothetical protein
MVATPWLAKRVGRYRIVLRSVYANPSLLLPVRAGAATAPLAGIALISAGLATTLIKPWSAWAAWPFLICMCAATLLAYRYPRGFLPAWLEQDLAAGRLTIARADRFDWLFLAIVGPLMIVAALTYPLFVVTQLG